MSSSAEGSNHNLRTEQEISNGESSWTYYVQVVQSQAPCSKNQNANPAKGRVGLPYVSEYAFLISASIKLEIDGAP